MEKPELIALVAAPIFATLWADPLTSNRTEDLVRESVAYAKKLVDEATKVAYKD